MVYAAPSIPSNENKIFGILFNCSEVNAIFADVYVIPVFK
jgi:hypothetical protein